MGRPALRKLLHAQAGDVASTWADSSSLEAAVGFRPRVSLAEGVAAFARWFVDNPEIVQAVKAAAKKQRPSRHAKKFPRRPRGQNGRITAIAGRRIAANARVTTIAARNGRAGRTIVRCAMTEVFARRAAPWKKSRRGSLPRPVQQKWSRRRPPNPSCRSRP